MSGSNSRMLRTLGLPASSSTVIEVSGSNAMVVTLSAALSSSGFLSKPSAWRVASILRSMYTASFWDSSGSALNRWMMAG